MKHHNTHTHTHIEIPSHEGDYLPAIQQPYGAKKKASDGNDAEAAPGRDTSTVVPRTRSPPRRRHPRRLRGGSLPSAMRCVIREKQKEKEESVVNNSRGRAIDKIQKQQ